MALSDRIGEILKSTTSEFTAECYELHQAPPLGCLVKTGDDGLKLYAVVYEAVTEGIDPGRRPIARGRDEVAEVDIYRSHPQLAKLLRTNFRALAVGHCTGGNTCHYLPPQPAKVHSFVYPCTPEEVRDFTQSLDFLSLLLNTKVSVSTEELVAACLRQASTSHSVPRAFLVRAGKELSLILGNEWQRLSTILKRIRV